MEAIIQEILERLRAGEQLSSKELLRILNDHNRSLPERQYSKKKLLPYYLRTKERKPAIWESWQVTPELEGQLVALLQVKPRRSASGVATITVITKPWRCSGACIYCPNDLRMPKSYLSDEPACQRAERNYFDPYLQVASRLRALEQMGHVTDKIELIVLGGSWSDYPREYQIWFVTELFRALNEAEVIEPNLLDAEGDSRATMVARERRHWYKDCGLSYEKDDLIAFTRAEQRLVDAGDLSYNAAIKSLYESGEPWSTIAAHQHATMADLEAAQLQNESAEHRVVGLVVETRPNAIDPATLMFLRRLGATKLQMGIQSLDPRIHEMNRRPTTYDQLAHALDLTRLFGFKTHTHFMVNLLGATPASDREDFRRFVTETAFQPDEIKLYPCALVKGTELIGFYETGLWQPYDEETLIEVLVDDVLATPAFTRISRMIRDFSAHDIVAGNKKVNLRQLVEARAEERVAEVSVEDSGGEAIQEIRHREISTNDVEVRELSLKVLSYETISTNERFLQWVTPSDQIAGFLRLSLPKPSAFETYEDLPVGPDEAMIREVHVYGRASSLHRRGTSAQHRGLGKALIERAVEMARGEGYAKINVISAIGTRAYYRTLGFKDNGLYQQRDL